MLRLNFLDFKFFRFVNSGMYFDFFLKKIGEIIVRNFLVYSALFFGEKFFIEVLTKKIIDNHIFSINSALDVQHLNFEFFFYQLLTVFFYSYFTLNVVVYFI